jgi:hypothetical protein
VTTCTINSTVTLCALHHLKLPLWLKWILLSSELLHGIRCFDIYVLGLPVGSIFKGQALTSWPLKIELICSSKMSVSNHFMLCSNPEDRRIHCVHCRHLVCSLWNQNMPFPNMSRINSQILNLHFSHPYSAPSVYLLWMAVYMTLTAPCLFSTLMVWNAFMRRDFTGGPPTHSLRVLVPILTMFVLNQ